MNEIKFLHGKNLDETTAINAGTIYLDIATNELWYDDPSGEKTSGHIRLFDGIFTDIYSQLADLNYKPITISSFTNNRNTVELGSTITSVTLNWRTNKTPKTLSIDGTTLDASKTSHTYNNLNLTSNKTYSLTATDERDASASQTTSITFANRVCYGVATSPTAINSDFVMGLENKILSNTRARTVNYDAGTGEYLWYCVPTRLGRCSFVDTGTGFTAAFILAGTISVTNSLNYQENYYVYRSNYPSLGNLNIKIS